MGVTVSFKKETYNVKTFADDLVLVLEDLLEKGETLVDKLKDFGMLASFKINNQKMMLTKI